MESNADERSGAYTWFFVVGALAIAFAYFLFWVDNTLTNSKREEKLGRDLYELRSAQTSLDSRSTDLRQVGVSKNAPAEAAAEHSH